MTVIVDATQMLDRLSVGCMLLNWVIVIVGGKQLLVIEHVDGSLFLQSILVLSSTGFIHTS